MQVVGYESERPDRTPALLLASDGSVTREQLTPDTELSYSLGERWCAGTVADGTHVACDRESSPYCDQHSSTWVCARCTGTCLKDEMDCFEEHAVYLAVFAPDAFKIGVTKSWRLETRLREQGADRAAHVHTVSNGRIARELEAGYTDLVPDRVRVPTKIAGLGESVDEKAWRALREEFDVLDTFSFDYGLDLDVQPVPETLLSGRVRGTKGRILVVETGGTTYAVDLRDLVGYGISTETSDRRLQSSLGSFS